MIMEIRMVDRDGCKRETMRLAISLQKGFEQHDESVVSPPSSQCVHGCHDLHLYSLLEWNHFKSGETDIFRVN